MARITFSTGSSAMNRSRLLKPFAALALCLAATPAVSQMPPPPMSASMSQAIPYLFRAGESDVFEITTSQIALQKSRNPQVRQFASMLIDHHTRTTNLALAAAKSAGIMPPPPVLDADKRAQIGQLLAAAPANFDRTFLGQQVPAHEVALQLHTGYARSGDAAQLRRTAQGAVPIVQSHLQQARRLLGGRG